MKPQTLKGFRDFLPEELKLRQKVIDICRDVFESFGFEPLETPSVEYTSTLLEKYGEEADKLVYTFKDKGDRDVGLIYDLTVPTAKVMTMYQGKISLPFKRYQIQRVWRAEKPQKGRYREFTQCDVDIFGVNSPMADAEILAIIYTTLKKLGFNKFTIRVNSRRILFNILEKAGIRDNKQQLFVLQSIDKLDKKAREDVIEELKEKRITPEAIGNLMKSIEKANVKDDPDLEKVLSAAESMGVPMKTQASSGYRIDTYMVRGLNYYTGTIFETVVDDFNIGSITAGGRYDNLVSLLGGPDITATGTTFGLDRICDVLEETKQLKNPIKNRSRILITIWPGYEGWSMKLAKDLRNNNISCELYLEEKNFDKQIKYALRKEINYVAFIGQEERKLNKIRVKDLNKGKPEEKGDLITEEDLTRLLK